MYGREERDWVDAVRVNLFDDWTPHFSHVVLASAQSAFQLLPGVLSPGAASDSPEITEPHNLCVSPHGCEVMKQPNLVVRNLSYYPSSRSESDTW